MLDYKNKNIEQSFKNIYKYGYFKIIKKALDAQNKAKYELSLEAFTSIINFSYMRHFFAKIHKVEKSSVIRQSFHILRKNSERQARQKLSILLLSEKLSKIETYKSLRALNAFRRRSLKSKAL